MNGIVSDLTETIGTENINKIDSNMTVPSIHQPRSSIKNQNFESRCEIQLVNEHNRNQINEAATITNIVNQEKIGPNCEVNSSSEKIVNSISEPTKVVETVAEQISEAAVVKPVEKLKKPSNLYSRITATILKRLTVTDEGISIGNINSRTVKFDKHCERRRRKVEVKNVDQSVTMEFKELVLKATENLELVKTLGNATKANSSANAKTAINRLFIETSSSVQPTSFLLNILLTRILLDEPSYPIRKLTVHYLDKFLFLHLNNPDRKSWLNLLLSACR